MADVNLTFGADTKGVTSALKEIQDGVARAAENTKRSWAEMTAHFSLATRGVKEFAAVLAKPLQEFSRLDDAATRLAPLVGGIETATEITKALRDEAANGTQTLEQLTATAGKLASVFKNTADIKKWTSAFHNISAGLGRDVNELVENFVKAKASGRFEGGFADMFAQKGVNIFEPLTAQTGKTGQELRKMATEGTLAFGEIEKALLALTDTGGKFDGMAQKMSSTFSGNIGTMREEWNTLTAEFARPVAEHITPVIIKITQAVNDAQESAGTLGEAFVTIAKFAAPFAAAAVAAKAVAVAITAIATAATLAKNALMAMSAAEKSSLVALGATAAAAGIAEYFIYAAEKEGEAADALAKSYERLNEARTAITEAQTGEELSNAAKSALREIEFLQANEKRLSEAAGMSSAGGLNLDTTKSLTEEAIQLAQARIDKAQEEAEATATLAAAKEKAQAEEAQRAKTLDKTAALRNELTLLELQATGNAKLIRQAKEQADYWKRIKEYQEAGLNFEQADRWAKTIKETAAKAEKMKAIQDEMKAVSPGNAELEKYQALGMTEEEAARYAALKNPDQNPQARIDAVSGIVAETAQNSIGGGRALSIGADAALSVAQKSLSTQEQMRNLLAEIAKREGVALPPASFN